MKFKKPDKDQLEGMLTMILGADAEAAEVKGVDDASIGFTAMYIDDDGAHAATCCCSLATAAALGCALSMIPPGGAEGMVEDKELTATATDNFYEVMNIFSSLLMNDKSAHLKLATVDAGSESRQTGDGFEEQAFSIMLGKYGKGELVFNYC